MNLDECPIFINLWNSESKDTVNYRESLHRKIFQCLIMLEVFWRSEFSKNVSPTEDMEALDVVLKNWNKFFVSLLQL